MFYYINEPRTPLFSIRFVKTESDFITRSFETDRLREMNAGGSCA